MVATCCIILIISSQSRYIFQNFGVIDTGHKCLNLILFAARRHIYEMKMNSRHPSLDVLKKKVIKKYYFCEKYLASVNGAYQKF